MPLDAIYYLRDLHSTNGVWRLCAGGNFRLRAECVAPEEVFYFGYAGVRVADSFYIANRKRPPHVLIETTEGGPGAMFDPRSVVRKSRRPAPDPWSRPGDPRVLPHTNGFLEKQTGVDAPPSRLWACAGANKPAANRHYRRV